MKKCLLCLISAILLMSSASAISARSAIVLDGLTGETLFAQNADEILPMASTTKIMTALVALESCDPDTVYTVKKEYTAVEGSSMYLREGEQISLRDTLYGLMLMSGNDAALAIAGECGGLEAFVEAMNDKAVSLGLANTHFENPNGLDSENHHTTARELAMLSVYAMKNPDFRKIVGTAAYTSNNRIMTNHNKMLRLYPDAVGVKTGFTKKSGRTLVSAAERNGRRLVAVTLNDPNDWADHMSMLENGFHEFENRPLHTAGETIGEVSCIGGTTLSISYQATADISAWLTTQDTEKIETVIRARRFVYAPIAAGEVYGTIEYKLGGEVIAQDTLVFAQGCDMLPETQTRLEKILGKLQSLFD